MKLPLITVASLAVLAGAIGTSAYNGSNISLRGSNRKLSKGRQNLIQRRRRKKQRKNRPFDTDFLCGRAPCPGICVKTDDGPVCFRSAATCEDVLCPFGQQCVEDYSANGAACIPFCGGSDALNCPPGYQCPIDQNEDKPAEAELCEQNTRPGYDDEDPCALIDCKPGFDCLNGACIPQPMSCAATTCPMGQICVDEFGARCLDNCRGFSGSACPLGYECIDNPGDDCDPDNGGADCGGVCIPEVLNDPCAAVRCGFGTMCVDGECIPPPLVTCASMLCISGTTCIEDDDLGARCVPVPLSSTCDNVLCRNEEEEICVEFKTGPGCVATCDEESECPDGLECVDNPTCDPDDGDDCEQICVSPCQLTGPCKLGFECLDGACVPLSTSCAATTCPTGQICVEEFGASCLDNCGGFAGFPCPSGFDCVDNPDDDCDPENGGADCFGVCMPGEPTDDPCATVRCGWGHLCVDGECVPPPPLPACADVLCIAEYKCIEDDNLGPRCVPICGNGLECPDDGNSYECVDDPNDKCEPANGDKDCSGICFEV